jgi:hypothetical protein
MFTLLCVLAVNIAYMPAPPIKNPASLYTYADYLTWPEDESENEISTVVQPDLTVTWRKGILGSESRG